MPIGRLSVNGPTSKVDTSAADVAAMIDRSLDDAVLFLDTNVFTTALDNQVWDSFLRRKILIAPMIWKELLDWMKTPYQNPNIRDRVIECVEAQVKKGQDPAMPQAQIHQVLSSAHPDIEVGFVNDTYTTHAYEYYLRLLQLRKVIGPVAAGVLERKLGRPPTSDEFLAEVQGRFGERGFLLAKKGREKLHSKNLFTDEQLVVMAFLTAIVRGTEVFIITRDGDVHEQHLKLACLMKEHYRSMLAAEQYFSSPESMAFRTVPVSSDGQHVPAFSGPSVLVHETTDVDFNVLPHDFHFVNIYCMLLGGGTDTIKLSFTGFCAETEMAKVLKVKAATKGLNTDRFEERNCVIHTTSLAKANHRVIITIGHETTIPCGAFGKFGFDDYINTLFCNERTTKLVW
jgi:hypothetical protein